MKVSVVIVAALAATGDWQQAIAMLPDLECVDGKPPDTSVIDPILAACAHSGAYQESLDLLCSMTQRGGPKPRRAPRASA